MQSYSLYKWSRDPARQVLIDFQITRLPVQVSGICMRQGIRLYSIAQARSFLCQQDLWVEAAKLSALSVYAGAQWYILYDRAALKSGHVRFAAAHELGHIFLGHRTERLNDSAIFRARSNTGDFNLNAREEEERAADLFAARLLAPLSILDALGADTPEMIAYACGLPEAAAKERAERLALARRGGQPSDNPLERQLQVQFSDFIRECRQ